MSYNPPPPRKSPYGDELQDDTWNSPQHNYQSSSQYLDPNVQRSTMSQVSDIEPLTRENITREDILFSRSYVKDLFFNRIIPIQVVACASLYAHNRMKQRPQRKMTYVLVSITSFFLGKYLYRDELKRRLETSHLNTPYMRALRKSLGITAIDGFGSSMNDGGFEHDASTSSWPAKNESTARLGATRESDFGRPIQFEQPSEDSHINQGTGPARAATYEELRARNRGRN